MTNANEVFGALAQGYSRWGDVLAQSHVSSGPAMADVLDKLMSLEIVQKRAPINDPTNKRKSGYFVVDPLSLFYYRYVFRNASARQLLDPEVFYDRHVFQDFEENYVPHMFEEICRQYLVRQNRTGKIEPAFDAIGKYWYDDPANKTSGEFDVVTQDPEGYAFYEAKFRKSPITQKWSTRKSPKSRQRDSSAIAMDSSPVRASKLAKAIEPSSSTCRRCLDRTGQVPPAFQAFII